MTLRRLFVPLILGCCVMALAAPGTAAGQSPGTDSVIGTASDCTESYELDGQIFCARVLSINVDVESGPVGENPTGTVRLDSVGPTPGSSITTDSEATCLSVSGRVAIIGLAGGGTQLSFTFFVAGLVRVVDAGGLDSGADTFESAYQRTAPGAGPPLPGPTSCSTFPGTIPRDPFFFPDFTNATGDVVVTDAQPFPTSKDQCKDGGWRNFPQFKNQGQCTAFVNHGP
jgi:hypothetical protein